MPTISTSRHSCVGRLTSNDQVLESELRGVFGGLASYANIRAKGAPWLGEAKG